MREKGTHQTNAVASWTPTTARPGHPAPASAPRPLQRRPNRHPVGRGSPASCFCPQPGLVAVWALLGPQPSPPPPPPHPPATKARGPLRGLSEGAANKPRTQPAGLGGAGSRTQRHHHLLRALSFEAAARQRWAPQSPPPALSCAATQPPDHLVPATNPQRLRVPPAATSQKEARLSSPGSLLCR